MVDTRMYPIQDGARVPWEVMAPHESQAQKNHGQSLEHLAGRGGLGAGEAWLVINGLGLSDRRDGKHYKWDWAGLKRKWQEYAERVNLHYERIAQLEGELTEARKQLEQVTATRDSVMAHSCELATQLELGPCGKHRRCDWVPAINKKMGCMGPNTEIEPGHCLRCAEVKAAERVARLEGAMEQHRECCIQCTDTPCGGYTALEREFAAASNPHEAKKEQRT